VQIGMPGDVGRSDRSFVVVSLYSAICLSRETAFGRVAWTSGSEWDAALTLISPALSLLSESVDALASDPVVRGWADAMEQPNRRRRILDAVVWIRDVFYTLAGHMGGATRSSLPPSIQPLTEEAMWTREPESCGPDTSRYETLTNRRRPDFLHA
jgi:hypothetical protein